MFKKIVSSLLIAVMCLSMTIPVFASDTNGNASIDAATLDINGGTGYANAMIADGVTTSSSTHKQSLLIGLNADTKTTLKINGETAQGVTWTSMDTGYFTVDQSGTLHGVKEGSGDQSVAVATIGDISYGFNILVVDTSKGTQITGPYTYKNNTVIDGEDMVTMSASYKCVINKKDYTQKSFSGSTSSTVSSYNESEMKSMMNERRDAAIAKATEYAKANSITLPEPSIEFSEITKDGKVYTATVTVTYEMRPCIHDIQKIAKSNPSCDKEGQKEHYACTKCGKIFSDENGKNAMTASELRIAKTAHTWNNGVVTKEPTTEQTGVKTYTCTVCKTTKTETIAKLEKQPEDQQSGQGGGSETQEPSTTDHGTVIDGSKMYTVKAECKWKIITTNATYTGTKAFSESTTDKNSIAKLESSTAEKAENAGIAAAEKKATDKGLTLKNQSKSSSVSRGGSNTDIAMEITYDLRNKASDTKQTSEQSGTHTNQEQSQSQSGTSSDSTSDATGNTSDTPSHTPTTITITPETTSITYTEDAECYVGYKGLLTNFVSYKDSSKVGKQGKWTSSNSKVISVDKNGKVKAKKAGKAKVTVAYANIKVVYNLTVKKTQKITKNWIVYKLNYKKKTAEISQLNNQTKENVKLPNTVKYNGIKFKVTSIGKNASKGNRMITTLTIPKNVSKIGKGAFSKCPRLKKIIFKTSKLKKSSVGKGAFKGASKKLTIKAPKGKLKTYKKFIKR